MLAVQSLWLVGSGQVLAASWQSTFRKLQGCRARPAIAAAAWIGTHNRKSDLHRRRHIAFAPVANGTRTFWSGDLHRTERKFGWALVRTAIKSY